MNHGFQFEKEAEGLRFRVFYTGHFVERYEVGEPEHGRPPVRRTVSEAIIRAKIEEAIPKISEYAFGDPKAEGVIVSERHKFIMVYSVVPRQDGQFQLSMLTTSPSLDFKARSSKDYVIKVNPLFQVHFTQPLSLALKVAIMADIEAVALDLEDGGTYHLGRDLMDYWIERSGSSLSVAQADWAMPVQEVQVS